MAAGLIKPAQRHDRLGGEAGGKPEWRGCTRTSVLNSPNLGRPLEESQGFKPDLGNLAVRDYSKPWWDCEPVLQSKEQERKPPTYSGARPTSIPITGSGNPARPDLCGMRVATSSSTRRFGG